MGNQNFQQFRQILETRRQDLLQGRAPTGLQVNNELGRIDGALERIASGRFGKCFRCGYPIEAQRLLSNPSTTICVTCLEQALGER